jgi:hypothetical protein
MRRGSEGEQDSGVSETITSHSNAEENFSDPWGQYICYKQKIIQLY